MKLKAGSLFYFWLHWVFIATRRLPLLAESKGFSLVAVPRILIAVAFLVVEPGL